MKLEKDEKVLVVRYANIYGIDCIKEHEEVINKEGYCWFGKCGAKTSKKNIDIVMNNVEPKIILTHKKEYYLCSVQEISVEKPKENYPDYYNKKLFENNNNPSIYFKINDIKKLDKEDKVNFVVASSHNLLMESLNKSSVSQMLAKVTKKIDIGG